MHVGLPEAAPPAHDAPAVVVEAATLMAAHVNEVSVCTCAAAEVVDQVVLNEPDGSCTVTV